MASNPQDHVQTPMNSRRVIKPVIQERCHKCGNNDRGTSTVVVVRYCRALLDLPDFWLETGVFAFEHLHKDCRRCGYSWLAEVHPRDRSTRTTIPATVSQSSGVSASTWPSLHDSSGVGTIKQDPHRSQPFRTEVQDPTRRMAPSSGPATRKADQQRRGGWPYHRTVLGILKGRNGKNRPRPQQDA